MNEKEFQDLVDDYFEGKVTPEMLKDLDRALSENEVQRIQFLNAANLIADLPEILIDDQTAEDSDFFPIAPQPEKPALNAPLLAMAAAVVIGIGAWFFFLNPPHQKTNPASVVLLEGWAWFDEKKLQIGERCEAPGRITAGTGSPVVLRYPDGSLLTLEEGSALRLEEGPRKKVFLEHGSLLAEIEPQNAGQEMIMDTENSTVTVLGTRYRFATTIIEDLLEVEHGKVRLLEKKTNKELIATRGSSSRVPGVVESLFPIVTPDATPPDGPRLPVNTYSPKRSWFTEDFDVPWSRGLWEIRIGESPQFRQWTKPEPGASIVKSTDWRGYPTNALKISRPPGDGPPVCLRLSEKVGWDCYFLKYYFRPIDEETFTLDPLCLELPEGTKMETIYEADDPEPLEGPDSWNRGIVQYLRYWDGSKWQVEVRRHLNFEHRSTVRLEIERTPAILFEVTSGGCLFDVISVGRLTPSQTPHIRPFEKWLCTEDFEISYHEPNWTVGYHDEERFYPISHPEKKPILQRVVGRRGKVENVLPLANPSAQGVPSQLRFRKRVRWDDFVLQYYYRPTSDEPLIVDPICFQLPEDASQEVIFERDGNEFPKESDRWNKVRIEYHRYEEDGDWIVEARRLLNDQHISTTRIYIERIPNVLLTVTSGAGFFDWIDVRKLTPETEMAKSRIPTGAQ